MKMERTVQAILLFCLLESVAGGRQWYVRANGVDHTGCGLGRQAPCRTLRYTAPRTQSEDTLFMDGSSGVFKAEDAYDYIYIGHTLTIQALNNTKPVIQCTNRSHLLFVGTKNNTSSQVTVTLKGLTIKGCQLPKSDLTEGVNVIHNARLSIVNCSLLNNGMFLYHPQNTLKPCARSELLIFNSTMKNNQVPKPFEAGITLLGCNSTTVIMTNNTLITSPIRLQSDLDLKVTLSSLSIDGTAVMSSSLDVTLASNTNSISLTRVNVSGHSYSRDSAVTIAANAQPASKPYVNFKDVNMIRNTHCKSYGSALSLIARFTHTQPLLMNCALKGVRFENNTSGWSGGAVYIENVANIQFNQCVFRHNIGTHGGALNIVNGKHITLTSSVLDHNIATSDPTAMTTGGAISASHSDISFHWMNFTNNRANYHGSAIYSDSLSNLEVQQSRFVISGHYRSDEQHAVIYAEDRNNDPYRRNASVLLVNNNFNLTGIRYWKSSLLGINAPLILGNNSFTCGLGQHLNFSAEQSLQGLPYGYNNIAMWCKACPYGSYTIHSHTNYTSQLHELSNNITECRPCPEHATCLYGNVIPDPNYWLEYRDTDVVVHLCAPLQCVRQTRHNITQGGCAPHRTGPLCDQCEVGYSLSVSSQQCIPSGDCMHVGWFYGTMMLCACVYVGVVLLCLWVWKHRAQGDRPKTSEVQAGPSNQQDEEEQHPVVPLSSSQWGLLATATNTELHNEETTPLVPQYQSVNPATSLCSSQCCVAFPVKVLISWLFTQALTLVFTPLNPPSQPQVAILRVLQDIVNLQPVYSLLPSVCAPDTKPLPSNLLLSSAPVWLVLTLTTALWWLFTLITKCSPPVVDASNGWARSSWRLRIWSASQYLYCSFLLLVFLAQVPLLRASFRMLHCVKVGNQSLIYEGGQGYECMSGWQHGLVVYVVICLLPLFIAVELSSKPSSNMTAVDALLFGIAPLVYCVKYLHHRYRRNHNEDTSTSPTQAIYEALLVQPVGPSASKCRLTSIIQPTSWLTIALLRCVVLCSLCTWLSTLPTLRAMVILLTCVIFTMYTCNQRSSLPSSLATIDTCIMIITTTLAAINMLTAVLYELSYQHSTGVVASMVYTSEVLYCIILFVCIIMFAVTVILGLIKAGVRVLHGAAAHNA